MFKNTIRLSKVVPAGPMIDPLQSVKDVSSPINNFSHGYLTF